MKTLARRLDTISESQTIAMARKSRELKAAGIDVISLSLGEPDFATPDPIKEAAIHAINQDFSYYTHVSGYLELREAICRKFKRDNLLDFKPHQIVVSTGAKQSIANAVLALVNPGDEVIIPAPYWVSYIEIIKLAEGVPKILHTTLASDFKLSASALEQAITPKTKLLLFSTPCNPTGTVYSREDLNALADVLIKHPQIHVISDEIYEHITFEGQHVSMAQIEALSERVITINGVSKGFAMTGWRGGILAASAEIAEACDKIQGQITSATCSITQKAMHAAMELDYNKHIKPMRDAFLKRRDLALTLLKSIPEIQFNCPQGAFYIYPQVDALFGKSKGNFTIQHASDLCHYLLEHAHVAVVPGAAFGDDRYLRFSYATSEDNLKKALNRVRDAIAELS